MHRNSKLLRQTLILSVLLLTGCGASLPTVRPEIPLPSVELMENEEERSKGYSQKVQTWLEKAQKKLSDSEPKPLPCKITSNECA